MSSVSLFLLPPLRGEPWSRPSWGRRYGAKVYGLSRHRHVHVMLKVEGPQNACLPHGHESVSLLDRLNWSVCPRG